MATNDLYQSTFMPIFQKAETKIKTLILAAFLIQSSIRELKLKIAGVIAWAVSQVPPDLHDKNSYLNGLKKRSEEFIRLYYKRPTQTYLVARKSLLDSVPKDKIKPIINNPKDLIEKVHNPSHLWAEAKGSPRVMNYEKELKKTLNELAQDPVTTFEIGKKPISLWQKAELDVRWKNNTQMLQDLRTQGVEYAWISSHPNCSKRCSAWQGSLVALNKRASAPQKSVKDFKYNKSSFLVGNIEGHNVYSLQDIMEVQTGYGYANNIITGFNCRHHLTPYKEGEYGPKKYSAEDIKRQREIEANIRSMEREIRKLKTQKLLYQQANQIKIARDIENRVNILVNKYKEYCERNGYAWHQYRINI